ncbi:hypothetical protein [Ascidiimonas sp. W6]|uniref:hypothetical protein n=1 Tax=Ascidiimonas meishanensis TaxID=3128903 RepID=UPI0030EB5DF1
MKKQRKVSLALNKKTVSNLHANSIKGGETNSPGCGIVPTGVSDCQECMEEPTQGCNDYTYECSNYTRYRCFSFQVAC